MPGSEFDDESLPGHPPRREDMPLSTKTAVGVGLVLIYVVILVILGPAL